MRSVPLGWTIKLLGEVATLQRGFDLPVQVRVCGDVPIFAANGSVGTHNVAKVGAPGVVTGRSGTLGEVHYVDDDYWPLNTALWVKDFHGNDPKWVARLLKWMQLETYTRGTGVPTLNRNLVHVVPVLVPPIAEQRRIAEILDRADAIRHKRQQAIALTEELLRSTFLDMFGDPVTNPKGWKVTQLDELLTFLTSGSRGWAKFYAPQGDLFLRIQNVKDGKLLLEDIAYVNPPDSAEARRTCVQAGDVLVSITADLGRTAVIPKGLKTAYINQHLALLRLNKTQISPIYASSFLASVSGQLQFERLNRGGVKAGLNFTDIKSLSILLPPLEMQQRYEKFFACQTNILGSYQQGVNDIKDLFNTLLQRAFRGEL